MRTAIYPAADLARAASWYVEVLRRRPYFNEPFYVGFAVGGFELGLVPDGESGTSGPQALWGVTNADEDLARMLKLGATLLEPVTEVGGGIRVAAVKDPFGNRFGTIENPNSCNRTAFSPQSPERLTVRCTGVRRQRLFRRRIMPMAVLR